MTTDITTARLRELAREQDALVVPLRSFEATHRAKVAMAPDTFILYDADVWGASARFHEQSAAALRAAADQIAALVDAMAAATDNLSDSLNETYAERAALAAREALLVKVRAIVGSQEPRSVAARALAAEIAAALSNGDGAP